MTQTDYTTGSMMIKVDNVEVPPEWEEAALVTQAMREHTGYKQAHCAKCDMPISVKSNDYLEDNSYCTTCAWDKMMMIPRGI